MRLPLRKLWLVCLVPVIVYGFIQVFLIAKRQFSEATSELAKSAVSSSDVRLQDPFLVNVPKSVIILTYQRCGSTFFGQVFRANPSAFYLFEPLDALYTAQYGTTQGWNVPSDITSDHNGLERMIPTEERHAVALFLQNLLLCDIDRLPTELFLHSYWSLFSAEFVSLEPYTNCARSLRLSLATCQNYTKSYCGGRFSSRKPDRVVECNNLLQNESYRRSHPDADVRRRFDNHTSCLSAARKKLDAQCSGILRRMCVDRQLRAVKVVRATMDAVGPLLATMPNLRVIHLLRDPRPVALSRMRFHVSGRGAYTMRQKEEKRIATEAKLYCNHVAADIRTRLVLERQFPGRFYVLTYEQFVSDPVSWAGYIYRFLNETLPPQTSSILVQNINKFRGNKTTEAVLEKWQKNMTYYVAATVARNCPELMHFVEKMNI